MKHQPDITGKNTSKRAQKGHFAPGTTGNPKGRPKGTFSITRAIKEKLQKIYTGNDPHKKQTYLEVVVDTIFENAIVSKDTRTLNQIWAYVDGRPKASIDLHTDSERSNLEEITAYLRKMGSHKNN